MVSNSTLSALAQWARERLEDPIPASDDTTPSGAPQDIRSLYSEILTLSEKIDSLTSSEAVRLSTLLNQLKSFQIPLNEAAQTLLSQAGRQLELLIQGHSGVAVSGMTKKAQKEITFSDLVAVAALFGLTPCEGARPEEAYFHFEEDPKILLELRLTFGVLEMIQVGERVPEKVLLNEQKLKARVRPGKMPEGISPDTPLVLIHDNRGALLFDEGQLPLAHFFIDASHEPVAIPAKDADGKADVAQFARDWFGAVAGRHFPEFGEYPFTVGNWVTRSFGFLRPYENRFGSWIKDLNRASQAWEALNSYLQAQSAGYFMDEALEKTGLNIRLKERTTPYAVEPFSFEFFSVKDLVEGGLSEPVDSNLTIARIREMERNGELVISDTLAALFATFDEKYTLQGIVSELRRIHPVNLESSHWLALSGLTGENREAGNALLETAILGMKNVYLPSVRRADARLTAALTYREFALRVREPNGGKIVFHAGSIYLSETDRWEPGRLVATIEDLLPVGATAVFAALSDGAGDDGSGLLDVLAEHAVARSLIEKKKVTGTFRFPSVGSPLSLSHGLAQLAKRWASEVEREKGGKILTEANSSKPLVIVQVRGGKRKEEGITSRVIQWIWPQSGQEKGSKNENGGSGGGDRGSASADFRTIGTLDENPPQPPCVKGGEGGVDFVEDGLSSLALQPLEIDPTPLIQPDAYWSLFHIVGAQEMSAVSDVGFKIVGASFPSPQPSPARGEGVFPSPLRGEGQGEGEARVFLAAPTTIFGKSPVSFAMRVVR